MSPVSRRDFYNGVQVHGFSLKNHKDLGMSSIMESKDHMSSSKNSYSNSSNKKDSIGVRLKPLSKNKLNDAYLNYFMKQ